MKALVVIALLAALPGAAIAQPNEVFLRAAAPQIGLFYVFRGDCGPCRLASPQIHAFADRYAITVNVISTDGARAPGFAHTTADRGQVKAWGLSAKGTPALLVYQNPTPLDPRSGRLQTLSVRTGTGVLSLRPCRQARGCVTFLGAGVMTSADIAQRVFDLTALTPPQP